MEQTNFPPQTFLPAQTAKRFSTPPASVIASVHRQLCDFRFHRLTNDLAKNGIDSTDLNRICFAVATSCLPTQQEFFISTMPMANSRFFPDLKTYVGNNGNIYEAVINLLSSNLLSASAFFGGDFLGDSVDAAAHIFEHYGGLTVIDIIRFFGFVRSKKYATSFQPLQKGLSMSYFIDWLNAYFDELDAEITLARRAEEQESFAPVEGAVSFPMPEELPKMVVSFKQQHSALLEAAHILRSNFRQGLSSRGWLYFNLLLFECKQDEAAAKVRLCELVADFSAAFQKGSLNFTYREFLSHSCNTYVRLLRKSIRNLGVFQLLADKGYNLSRGYTIQNVLKVAAGVSAFYDAYLKKMVADNGFPLERWEYEASFVLSLSEPPTK